MPREVSHWLIPVLLWQIILLVLTELFGGELRKTIDGCQVKDIFISEKCVSFVNNIEVNLKTWAPTAMIY